MIKDAIKDSLKSHQLFKKEHNNHPLAVNGSIFAYSNLANIYSNLGLNNIALDYLYKGQKLIHESEQPYIPTVRINMTLANVYSKLNKLEKSTHLLNEIYISALEKEIKLQKRNFSHFCILYRTNAQSRSLEDSFRRTGIPYNLVGLGSSS